MANWVRSFLEANPDKAAWHVHKRDKHSLHLRRPDGQIEANFTGSPMHYEETPGDWKVLDTALIHDVPNDDYGAPGLRPRLKLDHKTTVGTYSQQTSQWGLFNPTTNTFSSGNAIPTGHVDDDSILSDGGWWVHRLRLTETGLRETLTLNSLQNIPGVQAGDWIALDTIVTGRTWADGEVTDESSFEGYLFPKPHAKDSSNDPVTEFADCRRYAKTISGVQHIYTTIPYAWLQTAAYPVEIDPDFLDSTADGYVRGLSTTYATARTTATTSYMTGNLLSIQNLYMSPSYYIDRTYLVFDTSSIGTGSTVTSVTLTMTVRTDNSDTNFDVLILKQDWSAQNPIVSGNMDAAFDNCLTSTADDSIWRNTSGISTDTPYTSGTLSTSWVVKDNPTYYSIANEREWTSPGIAPENIVNEQLILYSQEEATAAYRPVLTVLYTAVDTSGATRYPTLGATSSATSPYDDVDWQTPTNIYIDDNANAVCTIVSTNTGAVGVNNTGVTTNAVSPYDDLDWDDKVGFNADDAATAGISSSSFDLNVISYLIKLNGLGFTIPTNATILGVQVIIQRTRTTNTSCVDACVQLLNDSGALFGNNKADTVNEWVRNTYVNATYGSSTDMWGLTTATLTPAIVNDADFGVGFAVKATGANVDIEVDVVTVQVWYSYPNLDNAQYSYLLKASAFGWNIPTAATITGLVVEVGRYGIGTIKDAIVKLLDASGALQGNDKADTSTAWPTTETMKSYGTGTTDMWGVSLTPAMMNDVDFGVAIAVKSEANDSAALIDYVRMTVYFTSATNTPQAAAGALSFVGATATRISAKAQAGALSFVGAANRTLALGRGLTGAQTFTGTANRTLSLGRALTGALTFIGSYISAWSTSRSLAGAQSFAGNVTKNTAKAITGSLSFVGTVVKAMILSFTGALTFVGAVTKGMAQAFAGALSFVGFVIKETTKTITGTLDFTGAAIKNIPKAFAGALEFVGSAIKDIPKSFAGALEFVGSAIKNNWKSLSGILFGTPWWLAGGVVEERCIAAYQPIAAEDLADSYINLSNPGTYNAAPGIAPSWNASDGWVFDGTSYLDSGVTPAFDQTWSMVIKMTDFVAGNYTAIAGAWKNGAGFEFSCDPASHIYFVNGTYELYGTSVTDGVLVIAGNKGYFDGNHVVTIGTDSTVNTYHLGIGAEIGDLGEGVSKGTLKVQAFAVYDCVLTQTQVGLITSAVKALPTAGGAEVGTLTKNTTKFLAGVQDFVGTVTKGVAQAFTGAVSFVGSTIKDISKSFAGALTWVGDFLAEKVGGGTDYPQAVAGALTFVGDITKDIPKAFAGALAFVGSAIKDIPKAFAGALEFVGSVIKNTVKSLVGSLFTPWWLAGGIPAANCVAVYQPEGAADLAASYINLANPGTYNATVGVALGWDTNGWKYSEEGNYLRTGIIPVNQQYSGVCRYSGYNGAAGVCLFGVMNGGAVVGFTPRLMSTTSINCWASGAYTISEISATSGVVGIAGVRTFFNGDYKGSGAAESGEFTREIYLGAVHYPTEGTAYWPLSSGTVIKEIAIYNTPITDAQMLAVSTAMAALPASSSIGNLTKNTTKFLAGVQDFVGSVIKDIPKAFAGTLTFVGSVIKDIPKAFTGALSFVGAQALTVGKALAGALSFVGNIVKDTTKSLSGILGGILSYTKTDIHDSTDGATQSGSNGINNLGVVVGWAGNAGWTVYRALRYPTDVVLELVNGRPYSSCGDINDFNVAVGTSLDASYNPIPVKWDADGTVHVLEYPVGALSAYARAINSSGVIVGYYLNSSSKNCALKWDADGTMHDLGLPPGATDAIINDINASGEIVGQGKVSGQWHPYRWAADNTPTDIGVPPGATYAVARAINDAGLIAGDGSFSGSTHALRWAADNTLTDLHSTVAGLGFTYSYANGINNFNVVTGDVTSGSGSWYPYTWAADNTPTALGLPIGCTSAYTYDINDYGMACGDFAAPTPQKAYLWSPVYSLAGTLTKNIAKLYAGALEFAGSVIKDIPKAFTGAVSFVGSTIKDIPKAFAGALSFAGDIASRISAKALDGALSFVGTVTKDIPKAFAGALSFVGTVVKDTAKALDGALSFVGVASITKAVSQAVAGAVSFVGSVIKDIPKAFAGALSFTGTAFLNTAKALAGALSFVGNTAARITEKALDGALTFVGTVVKDTTKFLAGALDFSGLLSTISGFTVTVSGALSFVGTVIKDTPKAFAGALTFVGSTIKDIPKAFSGALTFAGAALTSANKALAGALSFAGAQALSVTKVLAGALTFVGAQALSVTKALAGALSFTGSVVKDTAKALDGSLSFMGVASITKAVSQTLAGALSFTGSVIKDIPKAFAGALTFTGATSLTKAVSQALAGALSFVGTVTRDIPKAFAGALTFVGDAAVRISAKALTGALTFVGTVTRDTSKFLAGVLSFIGSLATTAGLSAALSGALSFVGTVTKDTTKSLAGALSFVGVLAKGMAQALAGALTFVGTAIKDTAKALDGALSFLGVASFTKGVSQALAGALSFAGTVTKDTAKSLDGALSFIGVTSITKAVSQAVAGSLAFVGTVTKNTTKALAGALSFIGMVGKGMLLALSGALSFAGSLLGSANKALAGALTFVGTVTKDTTRSLSGALTFVGTVTKGMVKTLAGALSFVGTVLAIMAGHAYAQAAAGVLTFTGTITRNTWKYFAGALIFTGTIAKNIGKFLQGALSFIGNLFTHPKPKPVCLFQSDAPINQLIIVDSAVNTVAVVDILAPALYVIDAPLNMLTLTELNTGEVTVVDELAPALYPVDAPVSQLLVSQSATHVLEVRIDLCNI